MSKIQSLIPQIKSKMLDEEGYCITSFAIWLINIIIDNNKYIEVIEDYGYDISTRAEISEDSYNLAQYETIEEFLENEFTGNTTATYISGHGLAAEKLYEEAQNQIRDIWFDFINNEFPELELIKNQEVDDSVYDELWKYDLIDINILEYICKLRLKPLYNKYLLKAYEFRHEQEVKKEIERQKFLKYQEEIKLLSIETTFKIKNFIKGKKFESNEWNNLITFLNNLVNEFGKEKVFASLLLNPIYCSQSVKHKLDKFMQELKIKNI